MSERCCAPGNGRVLSTAFDETRALRQRVLTDFALHLDRHPDFQIDFMGSTIEHQRSSPTGERIDVGMPDDVPGHAGARSGDNGERKSSYLEQCGRH